MPGVRAVLHCALLVLLLGVSFSSSHGESGYYWPLDVPVAITSSFGEYRPGRFHMGIDLRTGEPGKAVRAAGDGSVSRVRCSPWGYGKAIYVRLDDGNTVVYGHLEGFCEPLAGYVRAEQHSRESYTVDLYPESGKFRVARGEIIAVSGQTGVGPPHLHYEIRDPEERVLNPRLLGIAWPDDTPPEIQRIAVIPAGPASRANGDILPLMVDVRASGPRTADAVRIRGRVGLAVDVADVANGGANRLGVHTLVTEAGGQEWFRVQNDRLSYDTYHDGNISFYPFFSDGHFLLQWRWPGNRCEPFRQPPRQGWIDVGDEPIPIRISAADFAGNTASAEIRLTPGQTPAPDTPEQDPAATGSAFLSSAGSWAVVTAHFTAPESALPTMTVDGPASIEGGTFFRIDAQTFRAGYAPPPNAAGEVTLHVRHARMPDEDFQLHVFHRGAAARTADLGPGVRMTVAPESPYDTLIVRLAAAGETPAPCARILAGPYRIWPAEAPIDAAVGLDFDLPEGTGDRSRAHIYRATNSGWSFEETQSAGGSLGVSTRNLGVFAVMEDTEPPRIAHVLPAEGAVVTTRRPKICANVDDKASGIAEVEVACNGKWMLVAYDPEAGNATWEQDEDLPPGPKELSFTISDRAGNRTLYRRAFSGN